MIDLVHVWKSHSNQIAPKAMGNSICKRFIHCNDHELGASSDLNAPDKNVVHAQNVKLNAQATLSRLENQIKEIDTNIKKMPKDQQAALKARKTKVCSKKNQEAMQEQCRVAIICLLLFFTFEN